MSQQKNIDIVQLITQNLKNILEKFGSWPHTKSVVYINIDNIVGLKIDPKDIFIKHEDKIFNGVDFLNVPAQIIRKMLLVETYNPKTKQKEYEIPLSEDLYNIVLFSKSGKYNNKPKENSVNKERCKTLFLLDFNIDRNATNKESVYNLLENICNYAYQYTNENGDTKDLCKLYSLLKNGKETGALFVISTDFMRSPQKQEEFLKVINSNLDPRMIYTYQKYPTSWLQSTSSSDFNDNLKKLQKDTYDLRKKKLNNLDDQISRIEMSQDKSNINAQQMDQLLQNTFQNSTDNIKKQQHFDKFAKLGYGDSIKNISELLKLLMIEQVAKKKDPKYTLNLDNDDIQKEQIYKHFAADPKELNNMFETKDYQYIIN